MLLAPHTSLWDIQVSLFIFTIFWLLLICNSSLYIWIQTLCIWSTHYKKFIPIFQWAEVLDFHEIYHLWLVFLCHLRNLHLSQAHEDSILRFSTEALAAAIFITAHKFPSSLKEAFDLYLICSQAIQQNCFNIFYEHVSKVSVF